MRDWTDAHFHLQDPRLGNPRAIVTAMLAVGVKCGIVNATSEADWQDVETLALRYPAFLQPAFGIHPWHADTASPHWKDRLEKLLDQYPEASVGECGLDCWIETPTLEIQRPIFLAHLRLAREWNRPITIHCLKAWEALFQAFEEQAPPPRFLMHSFGGSIEIARRLIPLGAYFSFSGYFLQSRKSKVLDVFRQLPRERILLESDAPDMLPPRECISHPLPENHNHPANLASIGEALANALSISPDDFSRLTRQNAQECFGIRCNLAHLLNEP